MEGDSTVSEQIHFSDKAENRFNQLAEQLLLDLRPATDTRSEPAIHSSLSDGFKHTIKAEDIIKLEVSGAIDGTGKTVAGYFSTERGRIGLEGKDHVRLERFIEEISNYDSVRRLLSGKYIYDTFFDWASIRYTAKSSDSAAFVTHLKLKAVSAIQNMKVAVPVLHLGIEKPFKCGGVYFEHFPSQYFDDWETVIASYTSASANQVAVQMKPIREIYQGVLFASSLVRAEREKGIEIAQEATENALMLLRFISPSAFDPEIPCYFGRMGHVSIPINHAWIILDRFPEILEECEQNDVLPWIILERHLKQLHHICISPLDDLLTKGKLSSFEDLLLKSLYLYTRGIVAREFEDKLVFIMVSLETLLIREGNESILPNLGRRLAFLTEDTIENRLRVVETVKEAHGLRGAFLHHGHIKRNYQLLKELQLTAWTAFVNLLRNRTEYHTKQNLLEFLEKRILSD